LEQVVDLGGLAALTGSGRRHGGFSTLVEFWAPSSPAVAFFPDLPLADATPGFYAATLAFLVASGSSAEAGECDPFMASNASGTANYGAGQIAGFLGGRGVVAGVPTVLVV
jgi:hypothetical protein